MDCGATCLQYYAKNYSLETLRENTYIAHEGVNLLDISEAAEKIGFRTMDVKISFAKLAEVTLPCTAHRHQNHFVVVYEIKHIKTKYKELDWICQGRRFGDKG
jgi:ATP-binding cassette subfamily B protein